MMNAPGRFTFRDSGEIHQLAEILARGYVRFLSARESSGKELALPTQSEAPCRDVVNAQENPKPEEVSHENDADRNPRASTALYGRFG